MVGEIRDTETAELAVQAALTGHLVLSTLHTNDAPSSITRLLDLKVPGFLITSTVIGVLAQRLVRVICSHCAEEYEASFEEAIALGGAIEPGGRLVLKRGRGCLHCRQTGYIGRDGIFEVLPMTETIRRLVTEQADSTRLFEAGRAAGMRTLRESAIEKVLQGVTTVSEMVRVTGVTSSTVDVRLKADDVDGPPEGGHYVPSRYGRAASSTIFFAMGRLVAQLGSLMRHWATVRPQPQVHGSSFRRLSAVVR